MNTDELLSEIRDLLAELVNETRQMEQRHDELRKEYRAHMVGYVRMQRVGLVMIVVLGLLAAFVISR